jgi:hypothetical protein
MSVVRNALVAAVAALPFSSIAWGAPGNVLFSDAGESLTNFTVVQDADTTADPVDYSTFGIPEAPGRLPGSAATTGFRLTANKGDATAAITGINLVLGATPQSFSITHTLQYYVYMNVPNGSSGTSEQFLGGVARSNATSAIYGNFRTGRGNGGWFLLTGDNGVATDYRHLDNGTPGFAFADTDPNLAPKLNAAFTKNVEGNTGPNGDSGNEWVKVNVVMDAEAKTSSVYMNNVLFTTFTLTNTSGFDWLGYEDPATSIGSAAISGFFDNITVAEGNTVVPEPTALAATVPLAGLLLRRRRCRRR